MNARSDWEVIYNKRTGNLERTGRIKVSIPGRGAFYWTPAEACAIVDSVVRFLTDEGVQAPRIA